jgi:chromosomal replication initiation ATPase DnaA
MQSKRGQPNWPRMACMYICRKHYGYTLKEISRLFGDTSHVTVSTTILKCENYLKKQPNKINEIKVISRRIKEATLQGDL